MFIIGASGLISGVVIIGSTVFIKAELVADLHSESAAFLFGIVLASLALMIGAIAAWLSIRLLKGAFRLIEKHSRP